MLTILLVWVVPILWGALIGYFTNALAIRMLFRPLARKYLLGIPLPLTPGIIRGAAASWRGASPVWWRVTCCRRKRCAPACRPRRSAVPEGQLRNLRETMLRRPLAELAARAGSALRGGPQAGAGAREIAWPDLLRHLLERVLVRLVGSRAFIYGVRSLVQRLVDDLGARRLSELVGGEQLTALVTGSLVPALAATRSARS